MDRSRHFQLKNHFIAQCNTSTTLLPSDKCISQGKCHSAMFTQMCHCAMFTHTHIYNSHKTTELGHKKMFAGEKNVKMDWMEVKTVNTNSPFFLISSHLMLMLRSPNWILITQNTPSFLTSSHLMMMLRSPNWKLITHNTQSFLT